MLPSSWALTNGRFGAGSLAVWCRPNVPQRGITCCRRPYCASNSRLRVLTKPDASTIGAHRTRYRRAKLKATIQNVDVGPAIGVQLHIRDLPKDATFERHTAPNIPGQGATAMIEELAMEPTPKALGTRRTTTSHPHCSCGPTRARHRHQG